MSGKQANQKAQLELEYLRRAELDKKNMIKQILNNEKQTHDQYKKTNLATSGMSNEEYKRLMQENEKRQQYRDYQFGQRYDGFKNFQNKIDQSYMQHVRQPEMEKQSKMSNIIRKGEQEVKARQDYADMQRENAHKNWRLSNRATLEKQMLDKRTGKKAGETEYEVDYRNRVNHENSVKEVEYFERFKKKQDQNSYKDMLDNQLRVTKQRRLYGNMTGVEKSINKNDLSAFKNYDHNTYALIPGLNSSTKPVSNKVLLEKQLHKRDRSHEDELHRMNQFGLTRDVTLAGAQAAMQNDPYYKAQTVKALSQDPMNRSMHSVSVAKPNMVATPNYGQQNSGSLKPVLSQDSNNARSLLSAGHRKYPNHHLYGNYNPINGSFYQSDGKINNNVFKKAGGNIFF